MTTNMGTEDRIIRILATMGIVALYLTGSISGVGAIVLGVVAVILLLTSLVGFCPMHVPFGMSTRKHPSAHAHV